MMAYFKTSTHDFSVVVVVVVVVVVYLYSASRSASNARSRVCERMTSLSDVASSDTESSDTATDTTDLLKHSQRILCTTDQQSV